MVDRMANGGAAFALALLAQAAVALADALAVQHAGIAALALDHIGPLREHRQARASGLQARLEGGELHYLAGTRAATSCSSRPGLP